MRTENDKNQRMPELRFSHASDKRMGSGRRSQAQKEVHLLPRLYLEQRKDNF